MYVIYQKNNGTFDRFIVEVFLAIEKTAHRKKKLSFFTCTTNMGKEKRQLQKNCVIYKLLFFKG